MKTTNFCPKTSLLIIPACFLYFFAPPYCFQEQEKRKLKISARFQQEKFFMSIHTYNHSFKLACMSSAVCRIHIYIYTPIHIHPRTYTHAHIYIHDKASAQCDIFCGYRRLDISLIALVCKCFCCGIRPYYYTFSDFLFILIFICARIQKRAHTHTTHTYAGIHEYHLPLGVGVGVIIVHNSLPN